MKIAVCQINPVIGDMEYNKRLIQEGAARAKGLGCGLAIFHEMCLSGSPPDGLLERPAFVRENLRQLKELASSIREIAVVCGYVDGDPPHMAPISGSALILDGQVAAKGGKGVPIPYPIFARKPGADPSHNPLTFELGGMKWGVLMGDEVREAACTPEPAPSPPDLPLHQIPTDIEVLAILSASPYVVDKSQYRLNTLARLAKGLGVPVVYCNQVGGNDDLLFDGSSMVVDPQGRLICLAGQFEPDLMVWDTETDPPEITDPWPSESESVLKGLVMGTRDFVRKCGFQQVVLGLSGGIDSSLVACIAQSAVGAQNVTGVSMPSPYTSDMSKTDARELARNLGIRFLEISIHDILGDFKAALSQGFNGFHQDPAEENLQARIRGNLLMAIANKLNALMLNTGNRSELATGYCTLYGDLSGGLGVISDLSKGMCFQLAEHINRTTPVIPRRILLRPPSAELRPDQTDQDTLPPYDVLDRILACALEENLGFEEIVARGLDPAATEDTLRRLAFSEFKRRQAPPGLRIISGALGPHRHYPIARGRQVF
jgi:NAD+ synthetase